MIPELALHQHQRAEFAPTIFLLQELTGAIGGGLRLKEDDVLHRLYFWRQSNSYGLVYLNGRGLAFKMQINERGVREVGIFEGNSKKDLKQKYTMHLDHSFEAAGESDYVVDENAKRLWDLATAKLVDKFLSSFLNGEAEIFTPKTR
ncbi:hypothetical protein HY382_02145 [Candidatus Curtissbacteria bacterium]|nr:hypothetical protein [Candidatus Curtissbacteria bacterium]